MLAPWFSDRNYLRRCSRLANTLSNFSFHVARDADMIRKIHRLCSSDLNGFQRVSIKYLFFFNSIKSLLVMAEETLQAGSSHCVNGSLLICPQERWDLNGAQPFVSVTLQLVEQAEWLQSLTGRQSSLKMAKIPAEQHPP